MIAAVVTRRKTEAAGICSFEIAAVADSALPPFEPGADVDVQLNGGVARQYSLCPAPWQAGRYMIAVQRDPASLCGSLAMQALRVGDLLRIGTPPNRFPLVTGAQRSLFFASGIGITALLPMAEHLAAHDEEFVLHYCAGSAAQLAFCKRILLGPVSRHTRFHLGDGSTRQQLDLNVTLGTPEHGTQVYVCGPADFVDALLTAARAHGWPEIRLHRKYFAAAAQPGEAAAETVQLRSQPSTPSPASVLACARSSERSLDRCPALLTSCHLGDLA